MNALGFRQPDDKELHLEGAITVLGALLSAEHPAVAAAYVARLLAEANIPADLTLLGAAGDTQRVEDTLAGALEPETGSSWLLSSGCALRVLEAAPSC